MPVASGCAPLGRERGAPVRGVVGQCPGGGPGGAEDLEPVSLRDRDQPRHVGGAFGRGRQDAFEGRLADLSLESLELHRREADERPRSTGLRVERVRHSLGAERERAGPQRQFRVRDPERSARPRGRRTTRPPRDGRATASRRPRARGSRPDRMRPPVSSRPILIVCSIPSSQNASPSLSSSRYPVCARCGEMVVIACSFPCSWYDVATVYGGTVAKRTIAERPILVKPLARAAAQLASLLRERAGADRRARRGTRAPGRHSAALVRRPGPARGIAARHPDERARGTDPAQQERLHARRRPDGGGGARPPRPPRARPADDPRRAHRQGRRHDATRPPLPPRRNRTTTSPSTSPTTRSKSSPTRSRRSAHTPARFAPAGSAANPSP